MKIHAKNKSHKRPILSMIFLGKSFIKISNHSIDLLLNGYLKNKE